jgi:hypothetical protein
LIDGALPKSTAFRDPAWVGFQAPAASTGSHPQITIDLRGEYTLSHLEVVYLHSSSQAGGSITAPEQLLLSCGQDLSTFATPIAAGGFDASDGDAMRTATLDVNGHTCSYLRLDFRNGSQWTFLSEIRVYRDTHGRAVPRLPPTPLSIAIGRAQRAYDHSATGDKPGEHKAAQRSALKQAIGRASSVEKGETSSTEDRAESERTLLVVLTQFRRAVNGGIPPLYHILGAGQSLSVGWSGGPPLSTTQPHENLMLSGVGQSGDRLVPLIEGPNLNNYPTETISSAMANTLTAHSPHRQYRSIVTRHGQGSAAYSALKKGSRWFQKGMGQVHKAKAAAEAMGETYHVAAITLVHGESDHLSRQGQHYARNVTQWQADYDADIKAITGQVGDIPMFLCQMSSHTIYKTATSVVPQAQLSVCESSPLHHLVCPKYFLTYSDGVHLTGKSYQHLGEYYAKAIKHVLIDRKQWRPLSPQRATMTGAVITIDFFVPSPPLRIDTDAVMPQKNHGFEFTDSTNSASIQSVEIADGDSIRLTLSGVPTGDSPRVHYARTGVIASWAGWNQKGAARGNIRDSDPTPSLYGNTLHNWLVHFDYAIDD